MAPQVDTLISQFLCCTTRFKGEINRNLSGEHGVFPFREGYTTILPGMPLLTNDSVMATTRSGRNLVVNLLGELIFVRFSSSSMSQTDSSLEVCGRAGPPIGFSSFFPVVQISDQNLRVSVIACSSTGGKNTLHVVYSSTGVELLRKPFPVGSGKVTCAAEMGPVECPGIIAGTENGLIILSRNSEDPIASFKVDGSVSALASDPNYIFASTSESIKVFSSSTHLGELLSIKLLPDIPIVKSLLRPVYTRSSLPISSPKSVPSGCIFFIAGGVIGQVSLDTRKVITESLPTKSDFKCIFYGPFDNGPVMTLTGKNNELLTWETGYCLRVASRYCGKGKMVCAAVSSSRDLPQVFVASNSIGNFIYIMKAGEPLEADPECMQLAQLIIKQAANDSFGFNRRQIRQLNSSQRGQQLWAVLNKALSLRSNKNFFDFSLFCRELCQPEFQHVRQCFKNAKTDYPTYDPREICFREVWDLCKKIEYTWTDIISRTTASPPLF